MDSLELGAEVTAAAMRKQVALLRVVCPCWHFCCAFRRLSRKRGAGRVLVGSRYGSDHFGSWVVHIGSFWASSVGFRRYQVYCLLSK